MFRLPEITRSNRKISNETSNISVRKQKNTILFEIHRKFLHTVCVSIRESRFTVRRNIVVENSICTIDAASCIILWLSLVAARIAITHVRERLLPPGEFIVAFIARNKRDNTQISLQVLLHLRKSTYKYIVHTDKSDTALGSLPDNLPRFRARAIDLR